ncbi:DNA ligase D [Pelagibacterium flavum]|uniref:DNA ligase (ATP) n=1 Tax=Pelagibacterium flavum TaxID=2984530 RepID=A0ABY6ITT4_9HYPH|nr:DNA ligase D [Pelagibacterium sp. YIM 151497]UYQ73886.1 DNA ligase D [Pelagibacterium sp. YIM 151497]|tara:strand:+ start:3317 stop:5779 length:2463 start_codon:yes stop_codon:yes gene_type:complete
MAQARDLLDEYRAKRDFTKTSEPKGGKGAASGNVFVVQKHDATRLHYDFRLEYEGVLKSWAVTRGPSTDPADKRLAVRTEDHPLDYATFEGIIPKGQYGGGTVMLWDFGTWEPIEDPKKGFKSGKLKFRLKGERMKGDWALIRMKPKAGEKRENWLLIKEHDDFATDGGSELLDEDTSVSTGRKMAAIEKGKPPAKKAKADERPLPKFVEPQLATLVDSVPTGNDWLFEMKYDGYRCVAAVSGENVRLYTRNGLDWTDKFASLVAPMSMLTKSSALLDGEICAFDESGKTSFSTLKSRLSEGGPLVYFAFDLLEIDGKSLRSKPLSERKAALEDLLGRRTRHDPIQFSPDIAGKGEEVFSAICEAGHEGIIAKRETAPYRSGRGKSWLKVKCTLRQEFVIVGWSPSEKRRGVFASLLLATQEDGKLVYRGRVGTGFSDDLRSNLQAMLEKDARKTAPLSGVPREMARGAHWVSPRHLAEIAYTELTPDGVLRHPSFLGLREDKLAKDISLEQPAKAKGNKAMSLSEDLGIAAAEKAGIKLSSPEKVLYPGQGVTKGKLAAYYASVVEAMMPYIADRPLSLVRCPAGRAKQCFFQKHDTGGFAQGMDTVQITEKDGKSDSYFTLNGLEGLLAGVQMGVLEFHIWGSRRDAVEKPDRIVFDIDPDEGLDFGDVKSAALDIRDRLADLGLQTFAMVTGGKGIHVIAPVTRRAEWPDVKAFASGFAKQMAEDEPDRFTATLSKKARKGKMFIDYLRNERGSTAIAPYSTRAKEGAPVAVPVGWDEVETLASANGFSLEAAVERSQTNPWPSYAKLRQSLPKTSK